MIRLIRNSKRGIILPKSSQKLAGEAPAAKTANSQIPPHIRDKFTRSYIGKISDLFFHKKLRDRTEILWMIRNEFMPSMQQDPEFPKILRYTLLHTALTKVFLVAIPCLIKFVVNHLALHNYDTALIYLCAISASYALSSFFDCKAREYALELFNKCWYRIVKEIYKIEFENEQ